MINDEELVPIEGDLPGQRLGIRGRLPQPGRDQMGSRFDALLDVRSARGFKVTPLPITTEGPR